MHWYIVVCVWKDERMEERETGASLGGLRTSQLHRPVSCIEKRYWHAPMHTRSSRWGCDDDLMLAQLLMLVQLLRSTYSCPAML